MKNFLGLDRGIREHWVYKDSQYFHCWTEMLLLARYIKEPNQEMYEGELVTVGYGEFIFGRPSWSKRLDISEGKLQRFITKLIRDDMLIKVKSHKKCTVYKLVNYAEYNQKTDQQSDQQTGQQSDQQSDQRKTLIQQGFEIDCDQRSDQENDQLTISKANTKEDSKEVKNEIKYVFDYWNAKKIIVHRELTAQMIGAIKARLKTYELQTVLDTLDNFAEVYKNPEYYWTAKWGLNRLLSPDDFARFTPENEPLKAFKRTINTSISDVVQSIPVKKNDAEKMLQAIDMQFGERIG